MVVIQAASTVYLRASARMPGPGQKSPAKAIDQSRAGKNKLRAREQANERASRNLCTGCVVAGRALLAYLQLDARDALGNARFCTRRVLRTTFSIGDEAVVRQDFARQRTNERTIVAKFIIA